ncbi:Na(+)-translocating NADH-quinone reductase subunit B [Vibrio azureus]|uniref:Na(+)-translocating NADH-quinone reductase subunit B n=1 Tax=Vibrio azureus NBRC 104587 TaxID=1219077 RepID=U3AA19_9VIBR|nr:DUF6482 family protein [Vibrio azureus]AUI88304.1 Na(+)-translocating NADH-quinone reductase subunit B [Vibrio azureus]GAD76766.1 hypothetical protein VAZ01S_052_00090 [Vibrio azureus NBRC 104587]
MNLLIESVEGGIYLAYNVVDQTKTLIINQNNSPLTFASLCEARDHFRGADYSSAKLVHLNASDEMCGERIRCDLPLEIELSWY